MTFINKFSQSQNIIPKQLLDAFQKIVFLSEEEKRAFTEVMNIKKLKLRHYLVQQGESNRFYNFVLDGCLRMFYTDHNGYEHNVSFISEGEWVTDLKAIKNNSNYFEISALEPVTIVQISREDFEVIREKYPVFEKLFSHLTLEKLSQFQERLVENLMYDGKEKYINFQEKHPHLINRISNVQLASYLGITPAFLSKIRAKI